ncbi:MAG: hypothetical protein U9N46_05625 [Euryarchaeota archaeon]|nr:hypothetical protein [Euryarchaeota archaeon]
MKMSKFEMGAGLVTTEEVEKDDEFGDKRIVLETPVEVVARDVLILI